MKRLIVIGLTALMTSLAGSGCDRAQTKEERVEFYANTKPMARWWWFATEIRKPDIRSQLDWASDNNFGGVEIAWVYPLYRYQKMYARSYDRHYPVDTTAQKWLSPEWSEMVAFTKAYADSIGLSCDFTFGSAWPVAGQNIPPELSTRIYGDSAFRQTLTFSWAWPDTFLVIDHLDSTAFYTFAKPMKQALAPALQGSRSAMFTDSWEIKLNFTNKIWTHGFEERFHEMFGYDIIPYMEQGLDSFPDVRYDYMLLLDDYVTHGFYKPFVKTCREMGAWSRVQCLASPTDVMTTYGMVDIPETEAMLNNPNYSLIVSSAAALSSKYMVSSETFTCMYGFPATYLRKEQTADLKMVADAMFAQGVNQHVYHGMPYQPAGADSIDFFATTYFGPGGSLEPELPAFNRYIEKVSGYLQQGKTYSDVAVYIPYEDGVMQGAYPPERRRVWVWGEYEMRYIFPPEETKGYHPLWINRHFLEEAKWQNHRLQVGDAAFSVLYVDVRYMDIRALSRIVELAREGLPVCLKGAPRQPGVAKSDEYAQLLEELQAMDNVSPALSSLIHHPPLLDGTRMPEYWCRVEEDGTHYLFLAQLPAKDLAYPVYAGQSLMDRSDFLPLSIHVNGHTIEEEFEFRPYQSLLLRISPNGDWESVDISFIPEKPEVRPREPQRMHF